MNLVEFLRARLDDDQERGEGDAEHSSIPAVQFYGERMVAEVEAKRRIVDLHTPVTLRRMVDGQEQDITACEYDTDPDGHGWTDYPCTTLRLLALPYAGHEDYREEWRP